jgi:hypothetical protein
VNKPAQLTFQTIGGDTVTVQPRGKSYVQPRGYADHPGTGPKGETCGSCKHHCVKSMGKQYHKCGLAQGKWTGGRGSDILVRAEACSRWEAE